MGLDWHCLPRGNFAPINTAAYGFGALFVLQALLFAAYGMVSTRLRYEFDGGIAAWSGMAYIAYAAILYPLLGWSTGHAWPQMPMFGVTPCPVTIFAFGMLLISAPRVPRWLLVIPFVWSLIGGSAAFLLDVAQDWPLLFSGLIAIPLIEYRRRQEPEQ